MSPDERKDLKELLDTQYEVGRSSTKQNLPGGSSLIVDPLTKQNKANSKQILFDKLKIKHDMKDKPSIPHYLQEHEYEELLKGQVEKGLSQFNQAKYQRDQPVTILNPKLVGREILEDLGEPVPPELRAPVIETT